MRASKGIGFTNPTANPGPGLRRRAGEGSPPPANLRYDGSAVSSRQRRLAAREGRKVSAGAFFKRWTIPTIGAVTPIGLIVVNIAAFIDHHLAEFRWTIAVLAFVSGMMLNSWAALGIYRVAKRRLPNNPLVQEHNQELVLVLGMGLVIVSAFLSAVFCYRGLNDERELPNKLTFITGVVSILTPILLQAFFNRALGRGTGGGRHSPVHDLGLQPPPPPLPPSNFRPPPG